MATLQRRPKQPEAGKDLPEVLSQSSDGLPRSLHESSAYRELYAFDDFVLDAVIGLLRGPVGETTLRPKSSDLLRYLVRNAGRVISKAEFMDAVWAGVTVTEGSLTQAMSEIRQALGDSERRLVQTVSRRGYVLTTELRSSHVGELAPAAVVSATDSSVHEVLPLPSKPSLVTLPFANLDGDPTQDYFADGLVEELTTSLSKIHDLFVIARNSAFTYKGRDVDIRTVASELGVRYVIEGSVRRAANRIRVACRLVDGSTATHIWGDSFEGRGDDIFDLQDQLAQSIVGAVEPSIRRAEIERARAKRPDSLDAYDLYLRALPFVYANTPATSVPAMRLLHNAMRLDPVYPVAHAYAAWCHQQRFFRGGFKDDDKLAALRHAHLALRYGAEDPQALSIAAFAGAMITHDYDNAIGALDESLKMNSNSALTLRCSSMMNAFSERHERAREHANKALRLSPLDPLNYHAYLSLASICVSTEHFEDAVTYSTKALQSNPGFSVLHGYLIVSQVNLGRMDLALTASQRLLHVAPAFTIGSFARMAHVRPEAMRVLVDGLRKAGLPE